MLTFGFKFLFVFYGTDYRQYLFSDMGGFFWRANQRYEGTIFDIAQWGILPPFYHLFIFQLFKIAAFLDFFEKRLEFVLFVSILLSSLSVLGVYRIARIIGNGFWIAFLAAAFYALCYPLNYFNAFVMSENIAIPLLMGVTWLILERDSSSEWLFAAGLLFGVAVAMRPVFALFVFAFFFFILFVRAVSWKSFLHSVSFLLGFCIVLFMLLVESRYISKGNVKGLFASTNAVFEQFCKPHLVISTSSAYNGGQVALGAPLYHSAYPQNGVFYTDRPMHDHAYFWEETKKCIRENPGVWVDNLKLLPALFYSYFFPMAPNVKGSTLWLPFFRGIILFFGLSVGLFLILAPRDRRWMGRMIVLLNPFYSTIFACYFFVPEYRFLLPSWFGLTILFFSLLPRMVRFWKITVIYYAVIAILLAAWGIGRYGLHEIQRRTFHVEKMWVFPLEKAGKRYPDGTPGNQMGLFIMPTLDSGILLKSKMPRRVSRQIEISTDSWDSYRLQFYLNKKHIGDLILPAAFPPGGGIYRRILEIPTALRGQTFDRILVRPVQGDGIYSLAYLILDPATP